MNSKEIPIFFSCDDYYAPFLSVALHSAAKNASPSRKYTAIVLYKDMTEENRERLSRLATENFHITFVPMQEELQEITDQMANRLRCDYFTLTIYFRLFIPTMFPQYDKGIYVDSDVVIRGDLGELFDTDIGENFIGGCTDKSTVDDPGFAYYFENAVGVPAQSYINSGVLLMNLKALREAELGKKFLQLLTTYHFETLAPDQDYINAMCHGKIHYLDPAWNAMPNAETVIENPKIVHYNLFAKPWCYDPVRYGHYFWEEIHETGYEAEARAHLDGYTDAQRQSDDDCFAVLVRGAAAIPKTETTFQKMVEKGVKIRL